MFKKTITLAAALVLAGCGSQAQSAPPATMHGEPFLPAYLQMLQGQRPFPKDHSCTPVDLHGLLVSCDQP